MTEEQKHAPKSSVRKTNRIGGSIRVTVPAELCHQIGIENGDPITITQEEDRVVLQLAMNEKKKCGRIESDE